jgi:16S rRNA G966 N2-methylase RsmD
MEQMMKTATILKRPTNDNNQILVKLDPPFNNWDYEDVPHVSLALISCGACWANETYAFRADEEGQIIDWSELSMSRKGYRDHYRMLQESGYTLLNPEGL